jgi:hypothetical protein
MLNIVPGWIGTRDAVSPEAGGMTLPVEWVCVTPLCGSLMKNTPEACLYFFLSVEKAREERPGT